MSKIKVSTDLVSGEGPRPSSKMDILLCSHLAEGIRELSKVSLIRTLNLFMTAPPLRPNYLPKIPPPNTIPLGVRISPYELWEQEAQIVHSW